MTMNSSRSAPPEPTAQARDALFADLATRTGSALVHRIGHVAVLYRANAAKPGLIIPDPKADRGSTLKS